MADFPVEVAGPPRPVPASLRKRGITGVKDNLMPGQEANFVKPLFWAFREELEAMFVKPAPEVEHVKRKGGGHGDPTL